MIWQAKEKDAAVVAALARKLWPGHSLEELEAELNPLLRKTDTAIFLFGTENDLIGFAQCQLRRDYVEGTSSSPVGYLEGIYVDDAFRGRGAARQLLNACEHWSKEQGCREFASDCELGNETSRLFHLAAGFEEANRIICFTKSL